MNDHCRHCGKPKPADATGEDWLCPNCEHFQDTMACPVCGQPTRISLLPPDQVPEPHAPEDE